MDFFIGREQGRRQVVTPLYPEIAAPTEFLRRLGKCHVEAAFVDFESEGGDQLAEFLVGACQAGFQFGDDFSMMLGGQRLFFQARDLNAQITQRLGYRVMQFACND